jgi:inhibitor of KinA sporulation pathway (predicted exonuclease)
MPKRLEFINVVDVEATCWDRDDPLAGTSEIIQVGIAQLDLNDLKVGLHERIYVKPVRSKISEFCSKLTGITQFEVDSKGMDFQATCEIIEGSYDTLGLPWASYGDYDRNQFDRNCKMRNARYPFGSRHINVKTLLAASLGWKSEVGLEVALDEMGMTMEGRLHDGLDDAKNIARLLASIFGKVRT